MADGRKTNGGTRSGAGRPLQETREDFDRLVKSVVPASRMEGILNNLASEAETGNLKAIQILLGYWAGTPIQRQEIKTESQAQKVVIEFEDKPRPVAESE